MEDRGTLAKPGPSLVMRLVRAALLWAGPLLALTVFALTFFYRASTYRLFDEPLTNTITSLIAAADVGPSQTLSLTRQPVDARYQRALSGQYWIVGKLANDGTVTPIKASRSMAEETLILPISDTRDILGNPGTFIKTRADGPDENDPLRVVVKAVVFDSMGGEPVVMIAAALSGPTRRAVQNFALIATGFMLLLSGALVVAVFTQVRLGLKPVFDLREKVADVREGRAVRVDGDYPAEIQPLATELNSLIDHNKDVVEQAKTHVGNLAHALKTPLAVLLNEAAVTKSDFSGLVTRQSQTMKNQVDHHLRRARAAARGQAIGVSTSVLETLEPLARTLPRIHREKDISLTLDVPADLMFRGEKRDLDEMVGNLMDNACKWTVSEVEVIARIDPDDDNLMKIDVADNGPGLPPEEYAEAIKRGARLDEATPGTGFGLAIVNDLARAYKGDLTLGRADIGGLNAALRLPRRI